MEPSHLNNPQYAALLRSSMALRERAISLRAGSRAARLKSRAAVGRARGLRSTSRDLIHAAASPPPCAGQKVVAPAVFEPPFGAISVTDLFTILVDDHGFEVREAVRGLVLGLKG